MDESLPMTVNALTVDVEDYFHVSALAPHIDRGSWDTRPCRVERNVGRLLDLFEANGAHALEVREPLMDHELVEWLATLKPNLKVRRGEGKWLLKKAMEPHLPRDIMYRPKMGFAVPLMRWFRGPLRERVRTALLGGGLAGTGLFEARYLEHLVDAHSSGRRDYSSPLWTLLMFEAFLRKSGLGPAVSPRNDPVRRPEVAAEV